MMLDFMSPLVLGECIDNVTQGDTTGMVRQLRTIWALAHWLGLSRRITALYHWSMAKAPRFTLRHIMGINFTVDMSWIDARIQAHQADEGSSSKSPPDFAHRLLKMQRGNPDFKEEWAQRLIFTNFNAGVETTATQISAFLNFVTRTPGLQQLLREEILDAVKTEKLSLDSIEEGVPKWYETKKSLPLFWAVLWETMRLHPAIGTTIPRTANKDIEIEGYFIPAGVSIGLQPSRPALTCETLQTILGINPWVLNRLPSIFGSDAADFRPERWFEMDEERRSRLLRENLNFSFGLRICPGRSLADMILSKALPALILNFAWHLEDPEEETTVETMYIAKLKGCIMSWDPRKSNLSL
jgi:cytochrome P450